MVNCVHVLHLEDDNDDAELYHLLLGRIADQYVGPHLEFTWASSVDEAMRLVEEQDFDAVLCDYQVGGETGIDFLAWFRARHAHLPFIFLTGHGDEMVAREAFMGGATDYFVKDTGLMGPERLYNALIRHTKHHENGRRKKLFKDTLDHMRTQSLSLLESLNDAVCVIDMATHRVLYANETAIRTFNGRFIGARCHEAMHDAQEPCGSCKMQQVSSRNDFMHYERYNELRDRHFRVIDKRITWIDGTEAVFKLCTDITEEKRCRERIRRLKGLEQALVAITRMFMRDEAGMRMDDVLSLVGGALGARRTMFLMSDGEGGLYARNEWCKGETPSSLDDRGHIRAEDAAWITSQLENGDPVRFSACGPMPDGAAPFLDAALPRLAFFPLVDTNGSPFGAISIEGTHEMQWWDEEEAALLMSMARLILDSYKKSDELDDLRVYRTLMESTGTAIAVLEDDLTISLANREFGRMSGRPLDEVVCRAKWTEFVSSADAGRIRRYHASRRRGGEAPRTYQFTFIDAGGASRRVVATVELIPHTARSVVSLIDISMRDTLLSAMDRSENEKRRILDALTEQVIYYSPEHRIRWANSAACTDLGVPLEELKGNRCYAVRYGKDAPCATCPVLHCIETGTHQEAEVRRRDDLIHNVRADPIYHNGSLVGVVEIVQDVTEQRRMHDALEQSEEWLRTTLTSIGDAVIVTDTDARVVFMNPVASLLTKWENDDAFGRPLEDVFDIVSETTGRRPENPAARALRKGTVVGLANHTILMARDGSSTPIEDSASPILGHEGAVHGVVLVFRDASEKRESFLRLERQKEELSAFAHTVAHEMKSHITVIDGYADILRVEGITSPYLDSINERADKMRSYITTQLQLADAGLLIGESAEIDLNRVVASVSKQYDMAIEHETLPRIRGELQKISQLFNILLDNAHRHGGADKIAITARYEGESCVVCVTDDGKGIPDEHIDSVFDLGFSTGSTGFGLAIAKKVVEAHGGSIRVSSAPGEGTAFEFSLPYEQ